MTILVHGYATKADLRASIGKPLNYEETSVFGTEYRANGSFAVASRPRLSRGAKREFFARVTMHNDLITRIE